MDHEGVTREWTRGRGIAVVISKKFNMGLSRCNHAHVLGVA